jgi:hypothetical protein
MEEINILKLFTLWWSQITIRKAPTSKERGELAAGNILIHFTSTD